MRYSVDLNRILRFFIDNAIMKVMRNVFSVRPFYRCTHLGLLYDIRKTVGDFLVKFQRKVYVLFGVVQKNFR